MQLKLLRHYLAEKGQRWFNRLDIQSFASLECALARLDKVIKICSNHYCSRCDEFVASEENSETCPSAIPGRKCFLCIQDDEESINSESADDSGIQSCATEGCSSTHYFSMYHLPPQTRFNSDEDVSSQADPQDRSISVCLLLNSTHITSSESVNRLKDSTRCNSLRSSMTH